MMQKYSYPCVLEYLIPCYSSQVTEGFACEFKIILFQRKHLKTIGNLGNHSDDETWATVNPIKKTETIK